MKKTLIASAIALTSIAATNANANMTVTQMNFSGTAAASGTISDVDSSGTFTGSFFGHIWVATQETNVFAAGAGSFSGSNHLGAFDFSAGIGNMAAGTVGVGLFLDWNNIVDVPVLGVFNCSAGICTGDNTTAAGGMQTGPFVGSTPEFNGTGNLSAVPVPAAAWLMGTGLLGLIGLARRK